MALDIPTLTVADIKDSNWEDCLAEAREKQCSAYVLVLNQHRAKAASTGEQKREAVFQLFKVFSALALRSENPTNPFAHSVSGPGWRSLSLEDISKEQLAARCKSPTSPLVSRSLL